MRWLKRTDNTKNWERCPICDSTSIEGGSIEIEGHYAYQQVSCLACNAGWGEEYKANARFNIERGD
jgi:hypothetical protein